MPLGSSSAAPVTIPGPSSAANCRPRGCRGPSAWAARLISLRAIDLEPLAQALGGELARGVARQGRALRRSAAPSSESPSALRTSDKRAFGDLMLLVADAELGDQAADRIRGSGSSASRLPVRIIQAASAPAPSLPNASKLWSTISRASVSPARARSTASAMLAVDRIGDRAWQARPAARRPSRNDGAGWRGCGRSSAATAFSVTACGPCVEQQLARRLERGGAAFFRG